MGYHFGPTETCREFEVPNSTSSEWKKAFKRNGVAGLKRKNRAIQESDLRMLSIKLSISGVAISWRRKGLCSIWSDTAESIFQNYRSDQEKFYQLLSYKNDVDLNEKLDAWEQFYNFNRPHRAFSGKTSYEVLRSILN